MPFTSLVLVAVEQSVARRRLSQGIGKRGKNQQRGVSERPLDLTHVGVIYVSLKAQTLLGERTLSPERFNVDREMLS